MNPIIYIEQNREKLFKTYLDLHGLAEPSWQEKLTSQYIHQALKDAGISVQTFTHHYGLIAEIPGKEKEIVALRADMDALIQELDGAIKPNHSCGHDAHSTMVLYTALAIAQSGLIPKKTLRFIFQPAEEKGEGALQMLKDQALEDVQYLFGIHVRPSFEVPFKKASPVIIHSSAGTVKGTIKGVQAHAARPRDGINAIEAAALLVQKLKQIQMPKGETGSIKMTQLQSGNNATNVIPETAVFALDARAQTNDAMNMLKKLATSAINEVKAETGAEISWAMDEYVPAAIVNESAKSLAEEAITSILGSDNLIPACISPGGEDFHFYTLDNPGIKATMIGLGCGLSPGLHHPQMKFNPEALIYGTQILTKAIFLASEQERL
ncbi:amidohydrolase [Peribacillus deserti]|uniref:Amidohydrolase n=1 Tax=Peribacillus deserti TaxID=673318 RepID=A0ABS2QJX5_9BACI|nr:amidohydrolase [Peribacillus deserti]MBM7692798.1 amidohydrolase [Peribacillus deserti]